MIRTDNPFSISFALEVVFQTMGWGFDCSFHTCFKISLVLSQISLLYRANPVPIADFVVDFCTPATRGCVWWVMVGVVAVVLL